jgi:hypothetical protein
MTGGGIRAARNLSAAAVATIAAWSSYYHMVHVALHYGERPEVAYGLPFSVDGMLVVATIVMVDDKRRAHRVRPMARLAFTAGVIASIAANIAAAHPSIGARIIDAWPALALLLVVEMLARPPAAADTQTQHRSTEQPPAEVIRTISSAAAELPQAATTPADTSAAGDSAAEVPGTAQVPPAGATSPARDVAVVRCLRDSDRKTASADAAVAAGSDRHLRIAGTTRAMPHAVRTSANTHPSAAQGAQEVGGAAVPASRESDRAAARAELSAWAPPTGNFRSQVPAAEPVRVVARAAEVPAAEPEPLELSPASPATAGAAEQTVGGQGPTTRRPTVITRRMAHTIMAAEPQLSRTELANRLGVSTRRLREVLAA